MKFVKMLGLAAMAALALTAVMGAGAASAKVCSTAGTGASCGTGHGSVYKGRIKATLESGTSAQLTSSFDNVSCSESTVEGEVTNGETGAGFIDGMTFGNCSDSFGHTCTASSSASSANHWTSSVTPTSGTNGTQTVNNVTGEFTCPNPFNPSQTISCYYTATSASTAVTGSDEKATVRAEKVPLLRESPSNVLCSEKSTWSGSYWVTTPTSLNVTP
jgi:hypothetical protein